MTQQDMEAHGEDTEIESSVKEEHEVRWFELCLNFQ